LLSFPTPTLCSETDAPTPAPTPYPNTVFYERIADGVVYGEELYHETSLPAMTPDECYAVRK